MIFQSSTVRNTLSVITLAFLFFCACTPWEQPAPPKSAYQPILISREEANNEITVLPAKPSINNAGNFYKYLNFIFVIEKGEGIHIINNSNPDFPVDMGFLYIRNVTDIAIRGSNMYVNQSVDLVILNIQNINDIVVSGRIKNFANDLPPDGLPLKEKYKENRPPNSIVIRWELETNTTTNSF